MCSRTWDHICREIQRISSIECGRKRKLRESFLAKRKLIFCEGITSSFYILIYVKLYNQFFYHISFKPTTWILEYKWISLDDSCLISLHSLEFLSFSSRQHIEWMYFTNRTFWILVCVCVCSTSRNKHVSG